MAKTVRLRLSVGFNTQPEQTPSSGEMGAALKTLLGPAATGFSANTISRLKRVWAKEYEDWRDEPLGDDQWVYIWADGIYSGLRGEEDKLCALVIIGVNALGQKKFLAIEDGVRESIQSWREVLLKLKDRGMNAPKLAVATVPWASGRHWTKYTPKRAINAAGSTKP